MWDHGRCVAYDMVSLFVVFHFIFVTIPGFVWRIRNVIFQRFRFNTRLPHSPYLHPEKGSILAAMLSILWQVWWAVLTVPVLCPLWQIMSCYDYVTHSQIIMAVFINTLLGLIVVCGMRTRLYRLKEFCIYFMDNYTFVSVIRLVTPKVAKHYARFDLLLKLLIPVSCILMELRYWKCMRKTWI